MTNSSFPSKPVLSVALAPLAAVIAVILGMLDHGQGQAVAAALAVAASAGSFVLLAWDQRRAAGAAPNAAGEVTDTADMSPAEEFAVERETGEAAADNSSAVLDEIAAVCREISKGNFAARLINID
jgi:hypothetical protein